MDLGLTSLPVVETQRLHLRPLDAHDTDAFRDMTDHSAILEAVHFLKAPFTPDDARQLLTGDGDGRDCFLGVWARYCPDLIGTVGTHLRGEEEIEIGYWFAPAAQGRGYATEGVSAAVALLERHYPDHVIYAECRLENVASWRLLQRVGFANSGASGLRPGRLKLIHKP